MTLFIYEKIIIIILLSREKFTNFSLKIFKLKTKVVGNTDTLFLKLIVYKRVLLYYIQQQQHFTPTCLRNALLRILFLKHTHLLLI